MEVHTESQDRGKRFNTEFESFLQDVSERRAGGEIPDFEMDQIVEADKAMIERGEAFSEIFMQRLTEEYSIRGYSETTMADTIGKKELNLLKPVWEADVQKVKQYILNFPDWSRPLLFDFLFDRVDLLANLNYNGFSHLFTRLEKAYTVFSTTKRERMALDALSTVKLYAEILQQSLGFNPVEEIQRLQEKMISEKMERDWRDMSRNVRGSSSQIQSMKKRHRENYENMWREGLKEYTSANIIVQRLCCTEINKHYDTLRASMATSNLASTLNEIVVQTIAFIEKANESMETLQHPSEGAIAKTRYGNVEVKRIREDGIIVCKLDYGVGYFPESELTMEHAVTVSSMKLALEMAAVAVNFMKPVPEDDVLKAPNHKVQLVSSDQVDEIAVAASSPGYSLRNTEPSPSQAGPLSIAELQAVELNLNTSVKTVMVQLLLPNQRPSRQKLNENHTILDLYQHVRFLTNASQNFQLLNQGTQPPTVLSDPFQTVAEAKLNRVRVKLEFV